MDAINPVDVDMNQHSENHGRYELEHKEGITVIFSILQAFAGPFQADGKTGYGKYQSIFIIKSEFGGTIPIAAIIFC